ncbi:MAG: UvrD-helicase domain-containing protein [Maricaulaceae bacterium]
MSPNPEDGYVRGLIDRIFKPVRDMRIEDGVLTLIHVDNRIETFKLSDLDDFAVHRKGLLASDFILKIGETPRVFKWLKAKDSQRFVKTLNAEISQAITNDTKRLSELFFDRIYTHFPRDSWESSLRGIVDKLHRRLLKSSDVLSANLSAAEKEALRQAASFHPFDLKNAQWAHEQHQLTQRSDFFDRVEANPLTEEQRLAVLRNNDRNMVLAAAGTGKTSVIVAKALDLIDRGLAKPSEVLVLAYNNSAAKEIRERLSLRAQTSGTELITEPDIWTFHALGRQIIRDVGITTYMSDFTEDPMKLNQWVTAWISDYVKTEPRRMVELLTLIPEPIDPFSFQTAEEYEAYVSGTEFRTLADERVKGYQELLIANHLYMQGIAYAYEAPYVTKQRIDVGFDYRPDFHLTDADIYLEHFGISRDGSTRPDIDAAAYNASIESKRALHKEQGTRLIETFHYEWKEDTLLSSLDEKLQAHGIKFSPLDPSEIFEKLNASGQISLWSKRLLDCLKAIRTERLDKASLLQRLQNSKIMKAKLWADVLDDLLSAYVLELKTQDRIDFDDMILSAIEALQSGKFVPSWSYILVDEFQDISEARMDLIKALIDQAAAPSLTVVGDDWQSIYRFSGGKLELTTRFEDLVGSRTLTRLQKTFRYNNSIAYSAGKFVMENPEQYEKEIVTHTQVEAPQIYLLDDDVNTPDSAVNKHSGMCARVVQIVTKIRENDPEGSIAIIGRYNAIINEARGTLSSNGFRDDLKFWTYHRSKGLEADYVILVGMTQGRPSFPDTRTNETILEALLPTLDPYPHSEERRLLYVGMTRARHKVYIIGNSKSPSKFIDELMNPKYEIEIKSDLFTEVFRKRFKCGHCVEGYFQTVQGPHGQFYSCSSGLACTVRKARICASCGSPSIDGRNKSVCNNTKCRDSFPICPKCGRPMRERKGKFGTFWSCSGYGLKEDRCLHKVNSLPQESDLPF